MERKNVRRVRRFFDIPVSIEIVFEKSKYIPI